MHRCGCEAILHENVGGMLWDMLTSALHCLSSQRLLEGTPQNVEGGGGADEGPTYTVGEALDCIGETTSCSRGGNL